MYFHCSVYKTSKLLNVFWIIGTHNVYKITEVFMDIFNNIITLCRIRMFIKRAYHKKMKFVIYFPYV